MKCQSVACIWSGTPLSHRVTATAVLSQPPTLYTGGSDGSIIWWNLSFSDSSTEIKPVAVLCGHAATIADLGICYPVISGTGKTDISSNAKVNSTSEICGALVSACSDGVLCIWSRRSGHCRRRRKLPAWVGSPSMIRTIPSKPRYVCIGCCFIDSAHSSDHHSIDPAEGSEVSADKDYQHKKHSKCSVVIIDTYTLTIVQTVLHGNLSIGSLRYMAIVPPLMGDGNHSAVIVDSFGRLQMISISKEPDQGKVDERSLQNSSQVDIPVWPVVLSEEGQVLSVATQRNAVAFLLPDRCVFKLLLSGLIVGEVSFMDSLFGVNQFTSQTHAAGAMFLDGGDELNTMNNQANHETFVEKFAVWNSGGHAVIYMISFTNKIFEYEPLYEIPASFYSSDMRLSISFIQLNQHFIRIESLSSQIKEPFHWTPNITIWSLQEKHHVHGKSYLKCRMVGKASSLAEWISDSSCHSEFRGKYGIGYELNSHHSSDSSSESVNDLYLGESYNFVQKEQIVSSSMVISDSLSTPYAVVYGYFSGDVQILKLDLFQGPSSHGESAHCETYHHVPQLYLSGHMGPVLCLAVHRILGKGNKQVLLSGSMDCTIRIWDLESGNLIMVMHHHVAPVRQIILPPAHTDYPWSDCFLSVGEDSCVALASLETLQVERMFPGHRNYPEKVVWDGIRGYIACMCSNHSSTSDTVDILYIWDVKTGARERVICGTASHSMFDYFCKGIGKSLSGSVLNGNTSASSLLFTTVEDGSLSDSLSSYSKSTDTLKALENLKNKVESHTSNGHARRRNSAISFLNSLYNSESGKHPIKCSCPFPGIATMSFDLTSLMSFNQKSKSIANGSNIQDTAILKDQKARTSSPRDKTMDDPLVHEVSTEYIEELNWISSYEECLIRFSLSFLHVWDVDSDLDNLLVTDMKLKKPDSFILASGLQGDKGSLTVTFPGLKAVLELWKSSAEFCAMRSLMILSLAQHMISLFHSGSSASSALAAFYMRNFVDKVPDIKPPLLQLLVSFWQDESEHVRMAARSLFHCAASRTIPLPLRGRRSSEQGSLSQLGASDDELECSNVNEKSDNILCSDCIPKSEEVSQVEEFNIRIWLESYEMQDWISCVGGTSQDAMTSHIIIAAALAIWYRSLVKKSLPILVVHSLVKLVKSMNVKYSSAAAELLAEGMESTWKTCLGNEIPHLIEDILLQLEYVSGPSANQLVQNSALPMGIRETLVEVLLPNLAMADIPGFLTVMESQIWSTASDSPVHLVSLKTLIRVVRGCPRNLAPYLDKAVNFILQIMDPSNSVMRKICYQSSMAALKEVVHVFPMVSLNDSWTRLAVGDVIGDIKSASIRVYDLQSVTKIKVLDASGPPGLPSLLAAGSEMAVRTSISALSFSPDGEGVVAFSEHGLMIRWWSLGSVWWEKLSRNFVPVQCTKVIFVPPWDGFCPNSSRLSIMASAMERDRQTDVRDNVKGLSHADILKILIHSLDLSYRLEWTDERKVKLTRHGNELGTFQI